LTATPLAAGRIGRAVTVPPPAAVRGLTTPFVTVTSFTTTGRLRIESVTLPAA